MQIRLFPEEQALYSFATDANGNLYDAEDDWSDFYSDWDVSESTAYTVATENNAAYVIHFEKEFPNPSFAVRPVGMETSGFEFLTSFPKFR